MLWRISGGKITSMQTDWATIEINGAQRIIHPRRPTSCCRGGDGFRERYCSQKETALPAVSPPLARCVWEGMSNPVPVGSPRKSAAIIPFVNKTLTSGLPIGSIRIGQ